MFGKVRYAALTLSNLTGVVAKWLSRRTIKRVEEEEAYRSTGSRGSGDREQKWNSGIAESKQRSTRCVSTWALF